MPKHIKKSLIILLFAVVILSACSTDTSDWNVFAIEEEPAIDIQFRLPPDWRVDYAPTPSVPGQWEVLLLPPRCSSDQEIDFADNCVSLNINIKNQGVFDKENFLTTVSKSMSLNQSGTEKTTLMGQDTFTLDGLTVQRFNHKLYIGEQEVQLLIQFFETDNAFYTFMSEFPYEERDGKTAQEYDLLIESIEQIDS